jgi:hypothetical protein
MIVKALLAVAVVIGSVAISLSLKYLWYRHQNKKLRVMLGVLEPTKFTEDQ